MSVNVQKDPHSLDRHSTQTTGRSRAGEWSEASRRGSRYDIVVMAASAGGVQALQVTLSALPADFPAPIAVIQHRTPRLPNRLARVLARRTPLAAEAFGGRVIAVVLTGGDRDATDGVQSVKAHGGTIIAQDEASCEHFAMPRAAIEAGCVDWVLPLEQIGPTLVDLMTDSEAPTGEMH